MAIDPVSLALAASLTLSPAPTGQDVSALVALPSAPPAVMVAPAEQTAFIATSCKDPVWMMSGIQFLTCLFSGQHDELFGDGE
ncbi:MAG: hypothetical protein MUE98_10215 [Rhodobacteraceae bacterium]|jgi:hypothetical protein|nr:hypothetical protein [Paracoccaceae bacterium]